MPEEQKVTPFLKMDFIALEIKANNKEEAIRELAQPLIDSGHISNADEFLNEIFDREEKGSTGIGSGLAIPHCRTEFVKEILVSVGRKANGIDFDSIDDSKAQIFFMLAIPKDKMQTYIKIISKLTRILNSPNFKDKFLSAKDKPEILSLFKTTEENLH
jgi:fructose-specific phosphotransferase system IIA component